MSRDCVTDGWTDGWTDQRMDGQTAYYRDAQDSSKTVRMYLRHSCNVNVDLWYNILNHFGVNHFFLVVVTNWLRMDRLMDGPMDGWTNGRMDGPTDGRMDRWMDRHSLL